ncbi:MAG: LytR C-terminal domain-containing protein [Candidatus Roizmanbacteria bacterium]|nr:LytR C-terminal domain-containing protein [Candidatus Roizmanbacteria bacterium]
MKKKQKKIEVVVPELELDAPLMVESMPDLVVIDGSIAQTQRKWIGGIVLFILFIGLVVGTGLGYYKSTVASPSSTVIPTSQIIAPSPTPIVTMRIVVWNGSGIGGLAGKVRDELKIDGYNVVEVTNAPVVQKGTTLLLRQSVKSKETELISVLKKNLIQVTKVEDLIASEYDVKIILGN